jgi:hypothetical protein
MTSSGGALRHFAACEVCVRKQVRRQIFGPITDPTNLAVVFGCCYIANQSV